MKALLLLGVVTVVLGAASCGPAQDKSGARLDLADAKLVITQADGATHVLALAASGAVTFDNEPVVTLERMGHIVIGGHRLARVESDGSISANKVRTNATVSPEGIFVLDGTTELTIADDGAVTGPLFETMVHPRLKLEGAKVRYEGPPAARRAIMVGFAAFVTGLPAAVTAK